MQKTDLHNIHTLHNALNVIIDAAEFGRLVDRHTSKPGLWEGGVGSLVVRALDLQLNCREFDPQPPHYRSVGTVMGDRLRAGISPRHVSSHPGQLSLLPSVGRQMSTGQSAVMRCGWE